MGAASAKVRDPGLLAELSAIGFGYPGRPALLHGVDLGIGASERIALIGPNGAGKSTLLHLIVGLLRPTAGRICLLGRECSSEADFRVARRELGLLFQQSDDQLFCPTVLDDVAFGPLNLGHAPEQASAIAEQTLAALGLEGYGERVTHRLSGGEKRLVALATVLAMEPRLLLLDEPTNGLDAVSAERLLDHLAGLPQAMLIVSHEQAVLERLTTRAVLLEHGTLREAELHRHAHAHRHAHLHLHAEPVDAGAKHWKEHLQVHLQDHLQQHRQQHLQDHLRDLSVHAHPHPDREDPD
jgi:cobalt/nickel transport system ATP-binding protein